MHRLISRSPRLARVSVLALAAAAATAAGALAAGSSSAVAAGPSPCQTGGLVIWLNTNGNGTAGSIFYNLHFTNLSGRRCTLHGYPGVSAVNLRGGQLGRAASRDTSRRARTISVASGATATTVLRILDNGAVCPGSGMVNAAGLRVFPPNGHSAKTVPFPFGACRSASVLTVQAVRSGFGPPTA